MSTGTGNAEGPGDGGPLPRRQAAGSPAGRPLPHGRCGHLFHVVPAGDGGPRDGTLHVEFLPSALSLVSDEPVFLLRPYQRVLKNACRVGSVLGRDSPPLSPRAGRAASHGGAAACGWGTAPGRHAVRYFGTPREVSETTCKVSVLPRDRAAGTLVSPMSQTRTARTVTEKARAGGTCSHMCRGALAGKGRPLISVISRERSPAPLSTDGSVHAVIQRGCGTWPECLKAATKRD